MVRAALSALLLLLLAGCAHTHESLAADITELQVQVVTLRRRVDVLAGELHATAAAGSLPRTAAGDVGERLALLEAERLALRAELKSLREEIRSRPNGGERPGDLPQVIGSTPGSGALPGNEEALEVISVGSGELLLVRARGKLRRLRLVGVQAPRRAAEYEGDAPLLQAHVDAFKVDLELAWKSSKERLEVLLANKTARIRYDAKGPRREGEGIRAYVEVQGADGTWQDLGAAMIRSGFALAAGEHGLKEGYESMQRAAATDGAGLRRAAK